jgi:hypothetical protein
LAPRAEFLAVGEAHQVAVPRGLKVQAPEPVTRRIERAGDELILSVEPHGGRQLSVRNVVPTLTSNKR